MGGEVKNDGKSHDFIYCNHGYDGIRLLGHEHSSEGQKESEQGSHATESGS